MAGFDKKALKEEVARPTTTGVRSPLSGYPADGLDPSRLATILREADAGDPVRFMELAETIEERDPHYLGVLGTRKRAVAQLDITVEAASDSAEDEARAQLVRDWLKRDELAEELFEILDAVGKGYSFTEILWDTSSGQWQPAALKRRDQRWFRFARADLETPLLLSEAGLETELPLGKFIFARLQAKSGLPLRSGLARAAAWAWMFKAYTQRDWSIFTQNYGQPFRLGKYPNGASEEDKETLFRAVAYIAGDCAAIIPEGMNIDFVAPGSVGASATLYRDRADWLDQQISKAVLGQTATTDAVTGGLGSGKEHGDVRRDIETADARALAAILNRDLIRVWMQLEYGPLKAYPRLKIQRVEPEDLTRLSQSLSLMVDRGLEVDQEEVRSKFGLRSPKAGAKLMAPARASAAQTGPLAEGAGGIGPTAQFKGGFNGLLEPGAGVAAQNASRASVGDFSGGHAAEQLTERLEAEAAPAIEVMIEALDAMISQASDMDELRAMIAEAWPKVQDNALTETLTKALIAAQAAGRASTEPPAGGDG